MQATTEQTIRQVVQEVLTQLSGRSNGHSNGTANQKWGVFDTVDEAVEAAQKGFEKLSPKFLVVGPGQRLSWQYHHRRSEIWRLIEGVAGVATTRPGICANHASSDCECWAAEADQMPIGMRATSGTRP